MLSHHPNKTSSSCNFNNEREQAIWKTNPNETDLQQTSTRTSFILMQKQYKGWDVWWVLGATESERASERAHTRKT